MSAAAGLVLAMEKWKMNAAAPGAILLRFPRNGGGCGRRELGESGYGRILRKFFQLVPVGSNFFFFVTLTSRITGLLFFHFLDTSCFRKKKLFLFDTLLLHQ